MENYLVFIATEIIILSVILIIYLFIEWRKSKNELYFLKKALGGYEYINMDRVAFIEDDKDPKGGKTCYAVPNIINRKEFRSFTGERR